MAYNETLAGRVKTALAHKRRVEAKKMFGGLAYMVNGKMCVTVGKDRVMVRIDPAIHDTVLIRKGCRTMSMKGRTYRGYLFVDADAIQTQKDFDYWIGLALDYNKKAKASVRRKPK
jgi:TfoX/Sxy family transcriptional regulator of competence genes